MAEIEGIDMFIVFSDVDMGVGDLLQSQPDLSTLMGASLRPPPSLFTESRVTASASSPNSGRTSSRTAVRVGHEGATLRSRSRTVQTTRSSSSETHLQDDSSHIRESESLVSSFLMSSPNRTNSASPDDSPAASTTSREDHVGSTGRQHSWTHAHSSVSTDAVPSPSGGPRLAARGMVPPGLEQILQRALLRISGESIVPEFIRRILENQRRGNPPASKFAMENLEAAILPSSQPCTICQDEICKGSEAVHMPCKHTFHRECLMPWLEEHNTCPVCRCEIESHCARYNQSHFDKLKGPLQPVTVSNNANPSQMAPPTNSASTSILSGLSASGPGPQSSHVRMTIRLPFSVSGLELLGESSARAAAPPAPRQFSPTRSRPNARSSRAGGTVPHGTAGRNSAGSQRSDHNAEMASTLQQNPESHALSANASADSRPPKRRRLIGAPRKRHLTVTATQQEGDERGDSTGSAVLASNAPSVSEQESDAPVAARTRGNKNTGSTE